MSRSHGISDHFLTSLWQTSKEDASFLEEYNAKEIQAKRAVMGHLVGMLTKQRCPEEGESTSNLYRILVKKLKSQVASFNSDPKVVDVATKKLAKWVEGIVKEAYYRKQGLIKSKVVEQNQEAKLEKSNLKLVDPKKDLPKVMVIDGREYILKNESKDKNDKKKKEEEQDDDGNEEEQKKLELKIQTRPKVKNRLREFRFIEDNFGNRIPFSEFQNLELNAISDEQSECVIPSGITGKRCKIPDQELLVPRLVQEDNEKIIKSGVPEKNKPPPSKVDTSVGCQVVDDTLAREIDLNSSASPLIKNWSNWMVELTKKARNLVKWDASFIDQYEVQNKDKIGEMNSELLLQEKWNELVTKNAEHKLGLPGKSTDIAGSSNKEQLKKSLGLVINDDKSNYPPNIQSSSVNQFIERKSSNKSGNQTPKNPKK